jgi:periplasmic divalent cation tolerance protein
MNRSNFAIVLTTVESEQQSEDLAQRILKRRFAACVQIQRIKSHCWWNGKIEHGDEYLLLIKTKARLFHDLSEFIMENHPYETPEIVQIPITDGSGKYFEWMESTLNHKKS